MSEAIGHRILQMAAWETKIDTRLNPRSHPHNSAVPLHMRIDVDPCVATVNSDAGLMMARLTALAGVSLKEENNIDGVSFVLIPADTSRALQELVLTSTPNILLAEVLEPYFRIQEGEEVDMKLLQQQANQEREAGCSTGMCPHVSPATLRRSAEAGTVVHVKVSAGTNDEDGCLYLYWDESANLKQRLLNPRALLFLRQAGQNDDESIYGDVFLTRVREQQPVSLRLDTLDEQLRFAVTS